MYKKVSRPLLFHLDPELVHNLTIQILGLAGYSKLFRFFIQRYIAHSHNIDNDYNQSAKIFNLKFPNRLGLAAGYDKDAVAWRGLEALGFGHVEIGTVTPQPQLGNPKPRVFRIPDERALINRMGFPGKGAKYVAKRLSSTRQNRSKTIIGVNIGKNKDTPNEDAAADYLYLVEKFSPLADYLTVNVSSPNTVGLRRLQAREYLEVLLNELAEKRNNLPDYRPILVKLAPDLSDVELDDALAAITNSGLNGVIATNTTIERSNLKSPLGRESGGLSGTPLKEMSLNIVKRIHYKTGGSLPIVGVGGIMEPDDAKAMLDSGASLIQIYTSLIYNGPGIIKQMLQAL